jgi:hypothetical protein
MRFDELAVEARSGTDDAVARTVPPLRLLAAWVIVLCVDLIGSACGFWNLYRVVRLMPIRSRRRWRYEARSESLCEAVGAASVYYIRRVHCLQKAAAAVCLLRAHGIPAELVVGIHRLPFEAHAWVEVNRQIVMNDRQGLELYQTIARC